MRSLLALLLCASCCDPPKPLAIPPDVADCRLGPAAPAVPPSPRTLAVVVEFANANALALARTEAALAACRANLYQVLHLVREAEERR